MKWNVWSKVHTWLISGEIIHMISISLCRSVRRGLPGQLAARRGDNGADDEGLEGLLLQGQQVNQLVTYFCLTLIINTRLPHEYFIVSFHHPQPKIVNYYVRKFFYGLMFSLFCIRLFVWNNTEKWCSNWENLWRGKCVVRVNETRLMLNSDKATIRRWPPCRVISPCVSVGLQIFQFVHVL